MITSSKSIQEITAFARKETQSILKKIPSGSEQLYGFNSEDEYNRYQIKESFGFYSINDGKLIQTTLFFAPIEVDGQYRAIAKLEKTENNYHIVDFGSAELAREIQPHIKNNTQYKFTGILRIYHLYSDYLVFFKGATEIFIPLNSARLSLKNLGFNEQKNFYILEEIINHINAKK